jgi:hypothetical protein
MMRFRKEQIEAMGRSARDDFYGRLRRFLREELPDETATFDDAALRERIQESERRAARYGIESELGITQFACLTFAAGPNFDEIPEVREYLEAEGMGPEDKLDELVDYLQAIEDGEADVLDERQIERLDDTSED